MAVTNARPPARHQQQRQPAPTPAQNAQTAQRNADVARRATALDVMASRLNISSAGLKNTLQATVFRVKDTNGNWRSASDDEFAALVIVANEYKLNPLTKEIYAYPAKGGGIVPVVSIDGWLRIMNEHPQYDGIEFNDIPDDNGKLIAIESVIYRRDRSRPSRVTEYLDECVQNTDPWKKMPARMLRHKSTIQGARYAFGFCGIYSEGDAEIGEISLGGGGDLSAVPMRNVTNSRAIEQADPPHDPGTGEILDNSEGRTDDQRGEEHRDPNTGLEINAEEALGEEIVAGAAKLTTVEEYNEFAEKYGPQVDVMESNDVAGACNRALRDARERVIKK